MKSKKSQLKIQEMAFMIVALVFFFVLAGLFILTIFYSNMIKEFNEISESKTFLSLTTLANLPEFNCVDSKSGCIDGDKLVALTNRKSYSNLWQFSSLKIMKLSAFNKSEEKMVKCSILNYPKCDIFVVYDKRIKNEAVISSFVALCRAEFENQETYEKCEIAKLIVGNEIKT